MALPMRHLARQGVSTTRKGNKATTDPHQRAPPETPYTLGRMMRRAAPPASATLDDGPSPLSKELRKVKPALMNLYNML